MRSKLLPALAAPAVLTSLIISLYHLAYVQKIYPFVTAGKAELSNLSLKQAEAKIRLSLPENPGEITLAFGSQSWPVNLADLKINYDPRATAQSAYVRGRSENFFRDLILKFNQWRRPVRQPLVFSFDEAGLERIIDTAVAGIGEAPIFPALVLNRNNQVELIPGRNGRIVNQDELKSQLLTRVADQDFSPLEIPISLVNVDADITRLQSAQATAERIKDNQLDLIYQDFSRKISGQELLDLIGFSAAWDEKKIASLSADIARRLDRPAQNAAFRFDGSKVVEFKPALPGLTLNREASSQEIFSGLAKLVQTGNSQKVELAVDLSEPDNSLAEVNDWGIKELLGKGESRFAGSIPGRKHNIALAAGRINGLLVAPGEVFSFNRMVGDISRQTGYQTAYIIQNGRTVLGDGGGVCQVSTTLFRAALNAGLEIVERKAHAYRVGYYEQGSPAGLDATVFSPSVDLKFKNDTQNHILIQATVDLNNNYLRFDLYGTGDGRKASLANTRLWGQSPPPADLYLDDPSLPAGQIKQIDWKASGGQAAFDWLVERNGEIIHQKTFYSSYQPWQAVYLRGTAGI